MPFSIGDVVVIDAASGVDDPAAWRGILCRVTPRAGHIGGHHSPQTWVTPLTRRPDGYGMQPFYWATDRLSFVRSAVPAQRSETSHMPIATATIAPGDRVVLKPTDDYADNTEANLSAAIKAAGGMDGIFTVAMLTDQHRPHPLLQLEGVDGGYYVERFTFAPEGSEPTVAEAVAAVVEAVSEADETPPAPVPAPVAFAVGDRVVTIRPFSNDDVAEGETGTVTRVDTEDFQDYVGERRGEHRRNMAVQFDHKDEGGYFDGGEYIAIEGDGVDDSPMESFAHVTHEFAVGDRVRVVAASHIDIEAGVIGNGIGIIERIDGDLIMEGDIPHPWLVALDYGGDGSVWASKVVLSGAAMPTQPEPAPAPLEELPLDDWEVELLTPEPTPEPTPVPEFPTSYSVGDKVIVLASAGHDRSDETGAYGRAFQGDPFPISAEVRRAVSSPGYYSLMSTDGRIQTVNVAHLRPAPEPEVVSYSQAELDVAVEAARTEARTEAERTRQDEINGLTSQAEILRGQIDAQKRVVANTLVERLVDEEGWDRDAVDRLLNTLGIDPSVFVDEAVWEFQVTRTITHTVRATRENNRGVEPTLDFIRHSIQSVDTDDVELDSDWLDVEVVDTEDDWEVVRGSITRDS